MEAADLFFQEIRVHALYRFSNFHGEQFGRHARSLYPVRDFPDHIALGKIVAGDVHREIDYRFAGIHSRLVIGQRQFDDPEIQFI